MASIHNMHHNKANILHLQMDLQWATLLTHNRIPTIHQLMHNSQLNRILNLTIRILQ